jgi:calcium permeable stress-gated cation channel
MNPAFAASSLAPTSFVAPSQYYKLRNVQGVSGGKFADSSLSQKPSFTDSINSRVIGGRFMDVTRNSIADSRLTTGGHVVEKSGQLALRSPVDSGTFSIPDPKRFGPNYGIDLYNVDEVDEADVQSEPEANGLDEDWVDLIKDASPDFRSAENGTPVPGPSSFRRRPKQEPVTASRRETFPLRKDHNPDPDSLPPPHLRLQPSQPFVRPLDGINFDDLGDVYEDITQWRSRLKAINAEITDIQRESYNDVADGARIKGWLMVGQGLRFIPGIQLIEGRTKEDIRWDVLQNERGWMDSAVLWAVISVVMVLLAAGRESRFF